MEERKDDDIPGNGIHPSDNVVSSSESVSDVKSAGLDAHFDALDAFDEKDESLIPADTPYPGNHSVNAEPEPFDNTAGNERTGRPMPRNPRRRVEKNTPVFPAENDSDSSAPPSDTAVSEFNPSSFGGHSFAPSEPEEPSIPEEPEEIIPVPDSVKLSGNPSSEIHDSTSGYTRDIKPLSEIGNSSTASFENGNPSARFPDRNVVNHSKFLGGTSHSSMPDGVGDSQTSSGTRNSSGGFNSIKITSPIKEKFKDSQPAPHVEPAGSNIPGKPFTDSSVKADSKPVHDEHDTVSPAKTVSPDSAGEQGKYDKSYSKISAKEAEASHSKPKQLNKKLILGICIAVFGSIFLISFLSPGKNGKMANGEDKPQATVNGGFDYAGSAKKNEASPSSPTGSSSPTSPSSSTTSVYDLDDPDLPPLPYEEATRLVEERRNAPAASSSTSTSTTPVATVTIPDTRASSLPFSIPGIKGVNYTPPETEAPKKTSGSSSYSSYDDSYTVQEYSLPTREEYMNDVLGAYKEFYGNDSTSVSEPSSTLKSSSISSDTYTQQNDQAGKNEFFSNGTLGAGQGQWLAENTIWQGTIIDAVLTTELNTDLPGQIIARVTKNVYSSQNGKYLLIPQNSVLYGTYNSSITFSQSRVQVGWNTLIRPDGYQVQLGNMPGTDEGGASGLTGTVNDHPLDYVKAFALMSTFDILDKEIQANGQSGNSYLDDMASTTKVVVDAFSANLIDRTLNIQPTIKIKAGTKTNIIVNQNLTLPPVTDFPVTQKYERN